ncbi:tetraacyldisaccharide 4'-kinase [Vibrio rotiferianus]|uniref:Tetraacyldisaccharide 4'-kinase n=1 Tax=Vibrio rotiferianus TaxID=190895 RepID=A0A510I4D4_9VIBR|nr:tetraacyldisaccharide 4'-kinase [Vibrio rotiferianus]TMX36306.1 tetraacyldisaccharide 4'-kinase [Vibrio rotiferianus]TMX47523.1 tetraacyldisaccharide 4'-kinase [Vibrio rotiferianus]TMX63013.1 tetraacyldisaccharide 4'-kinase [Vibrio rotiferianus]CAH1556909.1 tetraacyldisaccharide 4'-kinase [Vibrio rotiferianus]BBL88341.1 tetraacyldisaccharide 4'-kinase [Vibrio rotiferianus]
MVEKIWFENHPLKYLLWPLLWPLSLLFGAISKSKRQQYQSGKKRAYKAPVPVVVVGNITAGGNGKTPVVVWLVEQLQQLGFKPGVVSRGYGAKAPHYPLILDDNTPAKHCGDEPKLIYRRTGAPVAVDPVRANAVKALLETGVDIIITDDGLQHYALERDIEFVIVDGNRRFGNESLIPLGPLREGVERLAEVDFIITNGGQAQQGEMPMSLAPSKAINLKTKQQVEVSELRDLVAFAGIGHPPRFFNTLNAMNADVKVTKGFADHQDFDQQELQALAQQGANVIMTEKDAVKCDSYAQDNWWYLPVSAQFESNDAERILNRIKEVKATYGSPSA